ncbi:MAG: proprotein convertase P-domain-containing protein [Saprospiraceae bacterium]|nr:proprotein convertase P-domain-containing protein [Saprospiraceae bacterium]
MRQFFTSLLVFGLSLPVFAQNNFWKPVKPESIALPAKAERKIQPLKSQTFQLDFAAMKAALLEAPMEFTSAAQSQPLSLTLPMADGALRVFYVWESPIMAPELGAKYPSIRNYAGSAADGSGAFVRLGVGPDGFHAFLFEADGQIQSVRPYSTEQDKFYAAYWLRDLPNEMPGGGIACGVEQNLDLLKEFEKPGGGFVAARGNEKVRIRKYRAAIAAKGEYTQAFGGTKPQALAAINVALNFIVGIQERDLGVRFELIPNNDEIVFLDPDTDPYTGNTVGDWMSQNPGAINPIIGINSYDMGHVFGPYVAGSAAGVVSGRVCSNPDKARGASSATNLTSEYFYLVAAHEMCHQLSGSHTWSNCPPNEGQLSSGTAFEPGSGSTIMSYAGACANNNNVQNDSDPYYHVGNIIEVQQFMWEGTGNTCGETIETNNNAPTASIAHPNNLFIPIGTPFQLTGEASDLDGDNLTYCWEQYDTGPASQLGQPQLTSPSFRSFPPNNSLSRTFPRINSIVFNQQTPVEVLPTYSREFNFKFTVRDNHPGAGGVDIASIRFNSTAQAGPFRVTYPNTNSVAWNVGEYQIVTWDVANTDKAPVNCKTVNILLSTNNGLLNQVTLASNVPNIGSACILVPNNVTNLARVRVQAADNIFFDISDVGFVIKQPSEPDFSICSGNLAGLICAPTTLSTEINTTALAGFDQPITLSVSNLPAGAEATFSPNPVLPGANATLTIEFPDAVAEDTYDLVIEGTANNVTKSFPSTYRVVQNDFSALALQTPANGAQSVDVGPTLRWKLTSFADSYEVQIGTSPSFEPGTILFSGSNVQVDTFKVQPVGEGQICYWRVRPINDCGTGPWTEPFVFVTRVQNCTTFGANDLPKSISANGTPTVESKITVMGTGVALSDVNVKKVQGNHQFMRDLEVRLISPAGTNVLLFKERCASYNGPFNIGFDDSSNGAFGCPPPNNGSMAKPAEALSAMNGESSAGVWTLQVKDNFVSSGGTLSGFEVELCAGVSLSAPFIVNNNLLQVQPGANALIGDDLLKADDPNNTANELTFTLITAPKHGELRMSGSLLLPGSRFTQADINAGKLRYYDYGSFTGGDQFRFDVTDGEGGLVAGTFSIQPFPVSTKETLDNISFHLTPNPATDLVRLSVEQSLSSDTRVALFNTTGQLLKTWTLPTGTSTLLLQVGGMPEGLYLVAVENEKGRGVKKLVVR